MTNTDTPQQQLIASDLRSIGVRAVPCGLSGFMIAGCYVSLSEAQTMVARYRRAAARRATLVGSVTR